LQNFAFADVRSGTRSGTKKRWAQPVFDSSLSICFSFTGSTVYHSKGESSTVLRG